MYTPLNFSGGWEGGGRWDAYLSLGLFYVTHLHQMTLFVWFPGHLGGSQMLEGVTSAPTDAF